MKKIIIFFTILLLISSSALAVSNLASKLSGRIVLEVERNGEAWYINPQDSQRYYLGRPLDAFNLLKKIGTGITNSELETLPIGLVDYDEQDTDADGLPDNLEIAIGTLVDNPDTDDDGFDDKKEVISGYNPLGSGILESKANSEFVNKNLGKIFLQVEKNGEAWYLDPVTKKRYYMARPKTAFEIMRNFGLGITNSNIALIEKYNEPVVPPYNPPIVTPPIYSDGGVLDKIADAIRAKDVEKTKSYFIESMSASIEYSIKNMADGNLLILANILSGSSKFSSSANKIVYKNTVDYNGEKYNLYFNVEKQEDGRWLLTNL